MDRDNYDDGRTVADMSGIPQRRFPAGQQPGDAANDLKRGEERPWETQFTRQERLATVFGAMGAAVLIGLIYLVAFGLVIFLLLRLWHA